MKVHTLSALFAFALLFPCTAQDGLGLPAPDLGPNFRSLERTFVMSGGTSRTFRVEGDGDYTLTTGRTPPTTLAEGNLTAKQLQQVRRIVLQLRAGEVHDTTVTTTGWGYSVKVDANGALGGEFIGAEFKTKRTNDLMAELTALEKQLQRDYEVDTPSDAEGYDPDLVDTPSDAEGYPDVVVEAPPVVEAPVQEVDLLEVVGGILGQLLDDSPQADTPSDAEGAADLEGFSGSLDHADGPHLTIGSGDRLKLTGYLVPQLSRLRGIYDGDVEVRGIWQDDGTFEVDEVVSPREVSLRGTYYPEGAFLSVEGGGRVPLVLPNALPSLHAKQLVVVALQTPGETAVRVIGFRAVTTEATEIMVITNHTHGHMRDFDVEAGATVFVFGEIGDSYRALINGHRGTVQKRHVRFK